MKEIKQPIEKLNEARLKLAMNYVLNLKIPYEVVIIPEVESKILQEERINITLPKVILPGNEYELHDITKEPPQEPRIVAKHPKADLPKDKAKIHPIPKELEQEQVDMTGMGMILGIKFFKLNDPLSPLMDKARVFPYKDPNEEMSNLVVGADAKNILKQDETNKENMKKQPPSQNMRRLMENVYPGLFFRDWKGANPINDPFLENPFFIKQETSIRFNAFVAFAKAIVLQDKSKKYTDRYDKTDMGEKPDDSLSTDELNKDLGKLTAKDLLGEGTTQSNSMITDMLAPFLNDTSVRMYQQPESNQEVKDWGEFGDWLAKSLKNKGEKLLLDMIKKGKKQINLLSSTQEQVDIGDDTFLYPTNPTIQMNGKKGWVPVNKATEENTERMIDRWAKHTEYVQKRNEWDPKFDDFNKKSNLNKKDIFEQVDDHLNNLDPLGKYDDKVLKENRKKLVERGQHINDGDKSNYKGSIDGDQIDSYQRYPFFSGSNGPNKNPKNQAVLGYGTSGIIDPGKDKLSTIGNWIKEFFETGKFTFHQDYDYNFNTTKENEALIVARYYAPPKSKDKLGAFADDVRDHEEGFPLINYVDPDFVTEITKQKEKLKTLEKILRAANVPYEGENTEEINITGENIYKTISGEDINFPSMLKLKELGEQDYEGENYLGASSGAYAGVNMKYQIVDNKIFESYFQGLWAPYDKEEGSYSGENFTIYALNNSDAIFLDQPKDINIPTFLHNIAVGFYRKVQGQSIVLDLSSLNLTYEYQDLNAAKIKSVKTISTNFDNDFLPEFTNIKNKYVYDLIRTGPDLPLNLFDVVLEYNEAKTFERETTSPGLNLPYNPELFAIRTESVQIPAIISEKQEINFLSRKILKVGNKVNKTHKSEISVRLDQNWEILEMMETFAGRTINITPYENDKNKLAKVFNLTPKFTKFNTKEAKKKYLNMHVLVWQTTNLGVLDATFNEDGERLIKPRSYFTRNTLKIPPLVYVFEDVRFLGSSSSINFQQMGEKQLLSFPFIFKRSYWIRNEDEKSGE